MKGNEIVWRTLLDEAIQGNRHWASLADVGFKASVPLSTTHLATKKLVEVGAIRPLSGGGLSVVSPSKIATILCAWRNVSKDVLLATTHDSLEKAVASGMHVATGGPAAAIHWLGGNKIANYSNVIAYAAEVAATQFRWEVGREVLVLRMDPRAELDWDGFSSIAQTYADLFATPGWQASEFRLALKDKFLPDRDWEQ